MKENFHFNEFMKAYLPILQAFPQEGVAFYEVVPSESYDETSETGVQQEVTPLQVSLGKKLKLIDCNQVYIEQSGYSKEKLLNADPYSLRHHYKHHKYSTNPSAAVDNQSYFGLFQWKSLDKKTNWIKFSAVPISSDGKDYILGLYIDITPQIMVQDKLQHFNARVAKVTHSIRVPGNNMKNLFDLMQKNSQNDGIEKQLIKRIKASLNHLFKTIEDNLNHPQIRVNHMVLKLVWASVQNIQHSLENLFDFDVTKKGLTWTLDFPKESLQIWADETRMVQFLQNIVDNAVKFTQKGGISVSCKLLGGKPPSRGIELTVNDTGIGIAQEDQERIFEPYQAINQPSVKPAKTALRLGLTIVKEIVEMLGGTILLSSAINQGTTFIITFPHMEYRLASPRIE